MIYIVKFGLGFVFLGMGFFILQDPLVWQGFIPKFIRDLLGNFLNIFLILTGIFDIAVGIGIIIKGKLGLFLKSLGALHLFFIIIFNGFNSITLRDIGLLFSLIYIVIFEYTEIFKKEKNTYTE